MPTLKRWVGLTLSSPVGTAGLQLAPKRICICNVDPSGRRVHWRVFEAQPERWLLPLLAAGLLQEPRGI